VSDLLANALPIVDPPRLRADARARELLASLLRPSQLDAWRRTGTFWVHTPAGWFRLGTLYDIRFRPPRLLWVERSICVVTEGFEDRPLPDLWAELAVAVQAIPEAFTAEANFRGEASARAPGADDVVALRQWLEASRVTYRRLRERGAHLDATYTAYDMAQRVTRSCRPAWAASYADRACELLTEHADSYPDERAQLLAAHRPVFEFADRVAGRVPGRGANRATDGLDRRAVVVGATGDIGDAGGAGGD